MDVEAFSALLPQATEQLPRGAFLTAGGTVWNPMTIGWAQFGVVWGRPVVTVMVRKSRYTHSLMEQAQVFTPTPGTYSAVMYYTEMDPVSRQKIFVEKDTARKEKQKQIVVAKDTFKSGFAS